MKNIVINIAWLLVAVAALCSGCTTEAWYESAKRTAENQCRKQPPGAAEECLSRTNKKTYQEYEKERTSR